MDIEMLRSRVKKLTSTNQDEVVETVYECDKCRDFGYTFKVLDNCEQAIPCECLVKKQLQEKLEKCGLSEAFKRKTFKTYIADKKQTKEAKVKAMKFCVDFKESNSSLLLCGASGSGKTHLGIAAMLNLIEQNVGCLYVEYRKFITELKHSVKDEENYIKQIGKYTSCKVLFIDDLLKGKITDTDLNYIYEVVNTRYLKGMPMIISTEKSVDDLLDYDEATASRIIEMAGENIISFRGKDLNYRLKK